MFSNVFWKDIYKTNIRATQQFKTPNHAPIVLVKHWNAQKINREKTHLVKKISGNGIEIRTFVSVNNSFVSQCCTLSIVNNNSIKLCSRPSYRKTSIPTSEETFIIVITRVLVFNNTEFISLKDQQDEADCVSFQPGELMLLEKFRAISDTQI